MIIVTGGAGFIGANLVRSLLEIKKEILVVEELNRYEKKFRNIENLIVEYIQIQTAEEFEKFVYEKSKE